MSKSDEISISKPENIVRLKIDGAKSAVNTLREQQTLRGVSLVCPFPSLEVDIPVRFGNKQVMTMGSIHRIGVEDDPETGLPKLRLSIRNRECVAAPEDSTAQTVIAQPGMLVGADMDIDIDVDAEFGLNEALPTDTKKELPSAERFFSDSDFGVEIPRDTSITNEAPSFSGFAEGPSVDEPLWVDCRDVPLPEEFQDRVRTRRRYRMLKHVVVASVMTLVMATGYLLHRTEVVDFSQVKNRMVALSFGTEAGKSAMSEEPLLPVAKLEVPEVKVTEARPPVSVPIIEQEAPTPGVQVAGYAPQPQAVVETDALVNPLLEEIDEAPAEEEKEDSAKADENTDMTLILPTRWPVEYSTAYRVRDPNGVVVDVPGGLVKREGWLTAANNYPMIRSIKAIQRESGARFIVYVNGDLPRYMTSPKANGVSLRLYHDKKEGTASSTVASR